MKRPLLLVLCLMLVASFSLVFSSCKDSSTDQTGDNNSPVTYDKDGNVQMAPPPAGEGVQIVIDPFDVPQGQEVQQNYWLKLPSDVAFDVARIQIATNKGTHHMNLFRTSADKARPDTVENTFYSNALFESADLMIEAQQQYIDWSMPEGVAIRLDPHQQLIIQTHYVNGSVADQLTPNGKGKIIINLYKAKTPASQFASMLFAQNKKLTVLPFSDSTYEKFCNLNQAERPLKILAMTGHFHSRGKTFMVERYDLDNNQIIDTIYRNLDWNEPPFIDFTKNPIILEKGQGLRFTARYVNPTAKAFPFGPHTDIEEHMNLFMWFTPSYKGGQSIYDFN